MADNSTGLGQTTLKDKSSQIELSQNLKRKALDEGFDLVGIASVPGSKSIDLRTAALERWLSAGHHADMNWMHAEKRKNIETLLKGVSSLLAVGLNYYTNHAREPNALRIARYGWGRDYHKVIEKKLKKVGKWLEIQRPNSKWRVCVDSSPLLDKAWAEEAGIGWIGKNSNLINKEIGSWILIGHLLSTEKLLPDKRAKPFCAQCSACMDQCPTNAISEPFVVNSNLCIAYHTIENKSAKLPKKIKKSLDQWIAGCDICQDVCPWNNNRVPHNNDPDMQPKDWMLNLSVEEANNWSDDEWKEKVSGTALKRIKPWMWRRNLLAIKSSNTINLKGN